MKKFLVLTLATVFCSALTTSVFSATVFRETMGTAPSTVTIAAHEAANGFDNDDYTMSGGGPYAGATLTCDVRNTSASTGYNDPAGNAASGLANIYSTATAGSYGFGIAGIDASTYTDLKLSFGYRKESASVNATFVVEWSSDGTTWNAITVSGLPAAGAAVAWYCISNLAVSSSAQVANLRLRWVKSGSASMRIDDVLLQGTPSVSGPAILITNGAATVIVNSYDVKGTNTMDIVGTMLFSNTTTGVEYTQPAPATPYGWLQTFSSLASGANSILVIGTNTANVRATASTTITYTPPAILITNGGVTVSVNSYSLKGTNYNIVGTMLFSNTTTGVEYTQTAPATPYGWLQQFSDMASGANSILVIGTNTVGTRVTASTTITCTLTPLITAGSLSAFGNQTINTTSSEKNYTVAGANLTANITITPPVGFEISTTSGSGFVANPSTLTLTQSGGTVATTTIYVHFKPTVVQAYSGNITHTSTGATQVDTAVSGTGTAAPATYYSQGSLTPTLVSSWNTVRGGGGSNPSSFTSAGDIFVIQNGHNMTAASIWTVGSSTGKLQIENGGTLTADAAITINNAACVFQIDAAGTYVHNNTTAYGSSIFAGTESFDAASTVILKNSNTTGPASVTFGNLTVNFTTDPGGSVQLNSAITTINGTFKVVSTYTSAREFRFAANSGLTMTIAGDMIIEGGSLSFASGSGAPTINLGGNFTMTGGTLLNPASVSTLTINGSASEFTQSAGTFNNGNINFTVASGKAVTLNNNLPVATSRSLTISGTLKCLNNNVTGAGAFTLSSGATLGIGSADGITSSGANGNIQVSGTRTFDTGANYTYNGTSAQVTGNGLPVTVNNLTINNTLGVSLSQNVTAAGTVTMTAGTLNVNGKTLGSAVTVQTGTTLGGVGTIGGAVTVNNGAFVAPGNSVGNLNVASLSLNGGSTYKCEITGASTYDTITVSGALTLPASGSTIIEIPANATLAPNTPYDVISYVSLGSGNITVDNLTGLYEPVAVTLVSGKVTLTTAPEPGVCMLAGLALLALRKKLKS